MLAAVLGGVVGLMMGLTGAGSVMAVPLMMWGLAWTQTQAVPVALVAVCISACTVTALTFDARLVRYKAAMLMALAGVPAIALGLHASHVLPEALLNTGLVASLLFVAWRMLRGDAANSAALQSLVQLNPATGRIAWTPRAFATMGSCGAATGFLSGLFGTGGGFFLTPSLLALTSLPMHSVVATTLMAVALISASGLATLALHGESLPWLVALPFLAGTLVGMYTGRKLAPRIKGPVLERTFAVLVLVVAARTLLVIVMPA